MQRETFALNPVIGADPEVFVYASEMGKIVSSLDLVGGTKASPRPLETEGFFVQEDNVLAEYNIPVSKSKKEFVFNIHHGLELIKRTLPEGFIPLIKSSHRFDPAQLEDPRAFVMGCDPDFNAWSNKRNPPPDLDKDPYLRSAGGHVHVGYDNPDREANNIIVRLMDVHLGIPSILLDKDMDRRKLYGKAGAYRDKSYGLEYRTLSSFWLGDEALTGWVWDQTLECVNKFNNGDFRTIEHDAVIVDTINNADVKTAEKMIRKYKLEMPS